MMFQLFAKAGYEIDPLPQNHLEGPQLMSAYQHGNICLYLHETYDAF